MTVGHQFDCVFCGQMRQGWVTSV